MIQNLIFKICILLSLILLMPAFAIQEVRKISLEDAIILALNTNPQLIMARIDTQIAKNDITIANQLKNPSITTFQNIGSTGVGNPQQVGVDYIVEILKRGNKKALAKSKSNAAYNNQEFQKYNLIRDVRISYINFLLKKSNLKFMQEQKKLSQDILNTAIKNYNNSKISKTDVIQAKIAYNQAIIYSNIAKSELISAQNKFNCVINSKDIDYDTDLEELSDNYQKLLTINPKTNNLTLDKIKQYALSNREDLKSAKEKIEAAKNNLKVARNTLIPDIELSGGYAYQTKGMSGENKIKQGAYAQASIVNIPLVYRFRGEIDNAQLEIEKANLNYNDIEIDIIRDITDAWEKYTIAKENLNFYNDELLINSKELIEESIKNLNENKIDLTSFLVSKKLYIEMELAYKQALSEYYISFAELLREMNLQYKDYITINNSNL